jgi:protein-S-isoprenylcysteine O-methyltransferase Ste14
MDAVASRNDGLLELSRAQLRRRMTIALTATLVAFLLLFVGSDWSGKSDSAFAGIRWTGLALILTAIAGRTWCALYIGGRKKVSLVQEGPYSLVRHPLYVFSVIGAAGIGALWGSVVVSVSLATITMFLLNDVIRREEQFMAARFGARYASYAASVGRFVPRRGTWRRAECLSINYDVTIRTLSQSLVFLVAIPISEIAQWSQVSGLLPIIARLP